MALVPSMVGSLTSSMRFHADAPSALVYTVRLNDLARHTTCGGSQGGGLKRKLVCKQTGVDSTGETNIGETQPGTGILRSYVPRNKDCVKPIKGVKRFNGRFEEGHLKSIPDW